MPQRLKDTKNERRITARSVCTRDTSWQMRLLRPRLSWHPRHTQNLSKYTRSSGNPLSLSTAITASIMIGGPQR